MTSRIDGAPRFAKRSLAVIPVFVLVLLALAPAPASARLRVVKTRVVMDVAGFIHKSGRYDYLYVAAVGPFALIPEPCVTHRQVSFFRVEPGPDTLIGSDSSDFLGEALVVQHEPPLASVPGGYYAKVKPVRVKKRRKHTTFRCKGAESDIVTVHEPVFHAAPYRHDADLAAP